MATKEYLNPNNNLEIHEHFSAEHGEAVIHGYCDVSDEYKVIRTDDNGRLLMSVPEQTPHTETPSTNDDVIYTRSGLLKMVVSNATAAVRIKDSSTIIMLCPPGVALPGLNIPFSTNLTIQAIGVSTGDITVVRS